MPIGGYIAGPQAVIDLLRQRARPYLFSNSLPPPIVTAGIKALELVEQGDDLRARLFGNTAYWRAGLERLGFDLLPGEHPIVPVMLGERNAGADRWQQGCLTKVFLSRFLFPGGATRAGADQNADECRAQPRRSRPGIGCV